MRARVVALGQPAAGDDGVGWAVLERLRAMGPADVELHAVADATALLPLLLTSRPVVLVDALLGEPPGAVRALSPEELGTRRGSLSSHEIGVREVIGIARALHPREVATCIVIVAVVIRPPTFHAAGLSGAVAAAVDRAAALALEATDTRW